MPLLTLPDTGSLVLSVRAKALVFEDPKSDALLGEIRQIAPSLATVLITGETGTGKEIVARHIHDLSRPGRPFLAVNCGAFSESLVESELFGHERGAFTGATSAKAGWFESAHGGTLFLDEIGDLTLAMQVKLLRVLQENEVVRLGSRQSTPIDVRLIAATNVNLEEAVAAGHFREDLFYRLNVATLTLPPLRERPGDILPLARYFLERHRQRLGTAPVALGAEAARRLLGHAWPGNIRELENVVHHALLICKDSLIAPEDLRLTTLQPKAASVPPPPVAAPAPRSLEQALLELFDQNLSNLYEHVEQTVISAAYRYCDRNQLQTARLLGISRNVVRARLIQYGELPGTSRSVPATSRTVESEEPRSGERFALLPRGPAAAGKPIRVGYQKFGLLMLAKAEGSLEQALRRRGFELEWIEYAGGTQLVEALDSNELALGVVGEGPAVFAQAVRSPIVYLAAEAPVPEGEAIVVPGHSALRSTSDLRGKSVALNRGANVHYLLIRALEEAGLAYDDVDVRFMPPARACAAFERGEVDAWAIWDPVLAELEQDGARVIRDGRGLVSNSAYYIATREFAGGHPELVDVLLSELEAVARWAAEHPDEVADTLAPKLGIGAAALTRTLRRRPAPGLLGPELIGSQQEVADAFFKLNLIPHPVTISPSRWSAAARNANDTVPTEAAAARFG